VGRGGARSLTPAGERGLTGDPALENRRCGGPKTSAAGENLKQSVPARPLRCPGCCAWPGTRARHHLGLFATTAIAGVIPPRSYRPSCSSLGVAGIAIHNFHQPDRETFARSALQPDRPFQTIHFQTPRMIVALAVRAAGALRAHSPAGTDPQHHPAAAQNSVAMRIQLMVMEKAASLDLQFYEDLRRTTFFAAPATPSTGP